jgi:hypothetical protein
MAIAKRLKNHHYAADRLAALRNRSGHAHRDIPQSRVGTAASQTKKQHYRKRAK